MLNKVVVSASGGETGRAAIQWCTAHLAPDTIVVAVCGVDQSSGFSFGLEPAAMYASLTQVEDELRHHWCEPLRQAGLQSDCRFLRVPQAVALREVIEAEQPDALVIGKRHHTWLIDAILGEPAHRLAHRPPCPIIVVPTQLTAVKRSAIRQIPEHLRNAEPPNIGAPPGLSSCHRWPTCRLAIMVREDETLVLDLLVAAAEHNAPAAWNPSLPATLRVNLPQTLGTTADVEGTLLAWIDAGTSLTVSFRRRRGVHLVQLSHQDTDITLQVEQTAQLH